MMDPTQRFSSRVENYIKYRPGYPAAIVDLLRNCCGMSTRSVIADVGSGTGILTELLLKNGNQVFAVEPNQEMRQAAEQHLNGIPNFSSVSGTAEATTLQDNAVDFIAVAQAFHWFNRDKTRHEFLRILKDRGWAVLIWNDPKPSSVFCNVYEELLKTFGTDYAEVNQRHLDAKSLGPFFGPQGCEHAVYPNEQILDLEGLTGRLLSASYAPEPGHPRFAPMLKELNAIFRAHEVNGTVRFDYETNVYYGQLV